MVHTTTCRLCGSVDAHMVSVFKKDENNIQYVQKITECIPVLIYRTDPLSKVICVECISQIDAFHKFRTLVLNVTDQFILQIKDNYEKKRVQLYLNALDSVFAPDKHLAPPPTILDVNEYEIKSDDCKIATDTNSDESKKNCINQTTLKILTPSYINKTIEDASSEETIDEIIEIDEYEDTETIFQPLTLLQCTLKVINSVIQADSSEREMCIVQTQDDETEAILENRKRKLEHNASILEHLLRSPDLGIKRIKLELYDSSKTSIDISMKDPCDEDLNESLNHNLCINFRKHRLNCKYCPEKFKNISELAYHEINHMHVFLGARVESVHWKDSEDDDMLLRNDWLYRSNILIDPVVVKEEMPDSEEISILVEPMIYDECQSEESQSEQIDQDQEHVSNEPEPEQEPEPEEEIPTSVGPPSTIIPDSDRLVNGLPFHKLKKDERYPLYGSVLIDGVKRKYCRFCKRDFKDTYAVDVHFMKNRCVRICKFCEAYYLKPDLSYFDHITTHKDSPYYNALVKGEKKNYYMQKKLNKIRAARLEMKKVKESSSSISPIKMKELFEKRSFVPAIVKSEPGTSNDGYTTIQTRQYSQASLYKKHTTVTSTEPKPPRTQYCRKCFKIFHDPDQLDIHYDQCEDNFNYDVSLAKKNLTSGASVVPLSQRMITSHTVPQKIISSKSHFKSDPTYKCSICYSSFPNWQSRNSHMRIHKMQSRIKIIPPINVLPLKPVSLRPKEMDENLARLVKNPQITIRPSNVSEMQSKIAESSLLHKNISVENIKQEDTQDSSRKYTCIPCGECFPSKSLMYTHKKSHCKGGRSNPELITSPSKNGSLHESDLDKKYRCVPCNKRFHNKASLYIHKKNSCSKTKVFECPFCKRKFGTESQYTSHILYNHPE